MDRLCRECGKVLRPRFKFYGLCQDCWPKKRRC